METPEQLQTRVRAQFPEVSAKADQEFLRYWGDDAYAPEGAYSWFESLANALNAEMNGAVSYTVHAPLFACIGDVLAGCGKPVYECIDVAFVENLFWRVTVSKAAPYWHALPRPLQDLYIGFHNRPPL
jgi:hypothetical protein